MSFSSGNLQRDLEFSNRYSKEYAEYSGYIVNTYGNTSEAPMRSKQNMFITALKKLGVWDKGDAIYLLNSDYLFDGFPQNILVNVKRPGYNQGSATGPPVFTPKVGVWASDSNQYLTLDYNPSADGINWKTGAGQDDASFFLGIPQLVTPLSSTQRGVGIFSGNGLRISVGSNGRIIFMLNDTSADTSRLIWERGLVGVTRSPDLPNVKQCSMNQKKELINRAVSSAAYNNDIRTLVANNGAEIFSDYLNFIYCGGGLSEEQVFGMNNAYWKYMI